MPVRRLGWDAKNRKWFEWGVAVEGEKFVWAKTSEQFHDSRNFKIPEMASPSCPTVTPSNVTRRRELVARSRGCFESGKLLAIDYGLTADELFSPARTNGTCARIAGISQATIFWRSGEQDLTAHVNFPAIQKAGEPPG